MANGVPVLDMHQACKNIQYRKDLYIEEIEAQNSKLRQSNEEQQTTYSNLHRKYQRLQQQLRDCGERSREIKQSADQSYEKYKLYKGKYTECKQVIRAWQQYYDDCKNSRADGGHGQRNPISNPEFISHAPQALNLNKDTSADTAQLSPGLAGVDVSITLPSFSRSPAAPENPAGSIQSTVGGSDSTECPSSPPVKREPSSDDAPVVISARSVKRKRSVSEHAMPPPVRVKHEAELSSQDTGFASRSCAESVLPEWILPRHQTSDLDALADKLATPRKPKSTRQAIPKQSPRSRSAIVLQVVDPTDGNLKTVGTGLDKPVLLEHASLVGRISHGVGDSDHDKGQVLRNLDVNAIAQRAELRPWPVKVSNRSLNEAADRIHILSEDGEVNRKSPVHSVKDDGGSQQLRLNSVLNVPSPDNDVLKRSSTPGAATGHSKRKAPFRDANATVIKTLPANLHPSFLSADLQSRRIQAVPVSSTSDSRRTRQAISGPLETVCLQRSDGMEMSPPPIEPGDEPLRLRPATTLRLEDFRINPKYMDSEYAWADTLRGRDQRRCLPGCTKPDCCGDAFMSFADMGAPTWCYQDDAAVLEAHLGPEWAELIDAHSPDKRAQILRQARAASLANQFGKHRQAFERRSTPPGFWRTDMPSTQEAEQDRVRAREMVREKIEERRREAMREGGRWLFRDE